MHLLIADLNDLGKVGDLGIGTHRKLRLNFICSIIICICSYIKGLHGYYDADVQVPTLRYYFPF